MHFGSGAEVGEDGGAGRDAAVEALDLDVFVGGVVGLVGVGVGDGEGGQAEGAGEDVLGEAAAERGDEQRLFALGGGDGAADGLGVGGVERGLRGVHGALPDDLDVGGVTADVIGDFGGDIGGALVGDEADVALGE